MLHALLPHHQNRSGRQQRDSDQLLPGHGSLIQPEQSEGDREHADRPHHEVHRARAPRAEPVGQDVVGGRLRSDEAAGHHRGQDGDLLAHFASSQFWPAPTSTSSGGFLQNAPAISRRTISEARSTSGSGPSKSSSSWICSTRRVPSPAPRSSSRQRTMATLMMSAAVPWITMFTARRSPRLRVWNWRERSSGTRRMRPNSVATYPSVVAFAIVLSMNSLTFGKRSR